MKRINIALLILLSFTSFNASSAERTESFKVFIWKFFKYPSFQVERVLFPVEVSSYVDKPMSLGPSLEIEKLDKKDWKHLKGARHFACERSCADIQVYDNNERKLRDTGKRVLAIEGVENGINNSYYFELIEKKWYLVKIEWLST